MQERKVFQDGLPKKVEEVVARFVDKYDDDIAIAYLKANPDDATDFCLQTFESYQSGDKSGVTRIGMLMEKLLRDQK